MLENKDLLEDKVAALLRLGFLHRHRHRTGLDLRHNRLVRLVSQVHQILKQSQAENLIVGLVFLVFFYIKGRYIIGGENRKK